MGGGSAHSGTVIRYFPEVYLYIRTRSEPIPGTLCFLSMKPASFGEYGINSATSTVIAAEQTPALPTCPFEGVVGFAPFFLFFLRGWGGLGALLTFDFLRILFSLGVFFGEALSGNPAPPQLGKVNRQGLGYKCFNGRGIGWGTLSFTPLQTNKQTKI